MIFTNNVKAKKIVRFLVLTILISVATLFVTRPAEAGRLAVSFSPAFDKAGKVTGGIYSVYDLSHGQRLVSKRSVGLNHAKIVFIFKNGKYIKQYQFGMVPVGQRGWPRIMGKYELAASSSTSSASPTALTTTYFFKDGTSNAVISNATRTTVTVDEPQTGSGPEATLTVTYADGSTHNFSGATTEPIRQSILTAVASRYPNISDPNLIVSTDSGKIFNLLRGTKDPLGPQYVTTIYGQNGAATTYTFPSNMRMAGHNVSGQTSLTSGMTLQTLGSDVKAAWNKGWTGKGQNILIVDSFYASRSLYPSNNDVHGITTSLLAGQTAIGATLYGLDGFYGNSPPVINNARIITAAGDVAALSATTPLSRNPARTASGFYFDVINASYGWIFNNRDGSGTLIPPDPRMIQLGFLNSRSWTSMWSQAFDGTTNLQALQNGTVPVFATDAVITKAAMNDRTMASNEPLNSALANNSNIAPRLLIVGALDHGGAAGASGGPGSATIAFYSNTAGTDDLFKSRFLVADGNTPYNSSGVAVDGTNVNSGVGTSYAAPRVAGYVAIVRQKFPNLTAPNTADIMLSTARYDTLSCYGSGSGPTGGCDKAIYGQGEASLSRALAPVGYLR
jgi:hypothetical protein